MINAKDFQIATADRILQIYRDDHQNRVLLADEVGLGKTIIAREVVRKVYDWHTEMKDPMFRIIYVCSNMNIANQNFRKLGVDENDCINIAESRLSMLHLKIYQKAGEKNNTRQLIPLTPATSFMKNGEGTYWERALLYVFLVRFRDLGLYSSKLNDLLQHLENMKYWESNIQWYEKQVTLCDNKHGSYINDMITALNKKMTDTLYQKILSIVQLTDVFAVKKSERSKIITELRQLFAQISLEKLEPDLIIMDEFQRFKDLIADHNNQNAVQSNERSMFSNRFLFNENTKVLLLSATPYKPYTTIEELSNGETEHYKEFIDVMDFLLFTKTKKEYFHQVWSSYSAVLGELKSDDITVLIVQKKKAEDELYRNVCRTERMNNAMIDTSKVKEMSITPEDIHSYIQMQQLMISLELGNFPIEYVKSSPYLLSIMGKYKVNEKVVDALKKSGNYTQLQKAETALIRKNRINNYKLIPTNNARLDMLFQEVFPLDKGGPELLLWIPASLPYYQTKGYFHQNKDYSKLLVFSSWEMVPRMIAVLTSYEAERRTVGKLNQKTGNIDTKYFASEIRRAITARLKGETEDLVKYASQYLASLYAPLDHKDKPLSQLKRELTQIIQLKIDLIAEQHNIMAGRGGATQLIELLKILDGKPSTDKLLTITSNAAETLATMAIGSPAVCALRIFKNEVYASNLAASFVSLFNKPESIAIIDLIYETKDEFYYENVFSYCAEGNLQAVLDEYAYVLGEKDEQLLNSMKGAFINTVQLQIKTREQFEQNKSQVNMRTHFATGYFNATISEVTIQRTENIRTAFNSPFRPFVLATTSIGQEGLDFHSYSRKIMHWNLPSNPVDLEQREGRINRYMCHAIRQNIANSNFGKMDFHKNVWEEMLAKASIELKGNNSDLVPYWCLPENFPFSVKIERIVPMYPYSQDKIKYDRLINVLSLYRLTLGQPRQEDLFKTLEKRQWEKGDVNTLYINLSPFTRVGHQYKK